MMPILLFAVICHLLLDVKELKRAFGWCKTVNVHLILHDSLIMHIVFQPQEITLKHGNRLFILHECKNSFCVPLAPEGFVFQFCLKNPILHNIKALKIQHDMFPLLVELYYINCQLYVLILL